MELVTIQIALFSENLISRPDVLMNEINNRLGNILDSMPTILNLPIDAPAEIPIAQIQSSNNIFSLNISRHRVDLIIRPNLAEKQSPSDCYKKYKATIDKYYKTVTNAIGVIRIGIIYTLFEEMANNVEAIFGKYMKENFPTNTTEISIRTNTHSMNKNIIYNNIRNVQAGDLHIGNQVHSGVVIQLDTNNIPNNEVLLTNEMLSAALALASNKLKVGALKELI